ncbi:MAG TPA: phosphoribosylglycinamide formyltransferase [Gemmatimonadales bacterium]|nr:phosphoribosylglycinamide formyltransferase [Gemmatimonadales bacterium]
MTVTPVRVAVLVSGGGTNLQALLDGLNGATNKAARVSRVISNRSDAGALDRGRRAGVPTYALSDHTNADEYLEAIGDAQLVVLAGYLKLVPSAVVSRFDWRIINIHPALLPEFGGPGMYGIKVHQAVLSSGKKESGASVHYVTEEYDRGDVIARARVPVLPGDTPGTLAARVLTAEHRLLPHVVTVLSLMGLPNHAVRLEDLDAQ